ncbi:helix-turn-helix domain-containing protein [Allopusillimonas ginsengisoli]|uniref:helix-turn-helix domain-containing protein n=1 Tax=Allopusillimonas ginsengisoli TaxID=453575 RepID=UPI0039C2533E
MPKKKSTIHIVNMNAHDKTIMWGQCVRVQRVKQRMLAKDLCKRISISASTLRRLESGDPGVAAVAYLSALDVLGLLDHAAPDLDPGLYQGDLMARVRTAPDDDDDF